MKTGPQAPRSGAALAASCDFQSPANPTAFRRWLFSNCLVGPILTSYRATPQELLDPLTIRERQIVQLIAEGKSSKDIGEALHLSVRTVETHRSRIMEKLNMHNVAALVRYAVRRGLISA